MANSKHQALNPNEGATSKDKVRTGNARRRKYTLPALLANAKGPSPHRDLNKDRRVGRELL